MFFRWNSVGCIPGLYPHDKLYLVMGFIVWYPSKWHKHPFQWKNLLCLHQSLWLCLLFWNLFIELFHTYISHRTTTAITTVKTVQKTYIYILRKRRRNRLSFSSLRCAIKRSIHLPRGGVLTDFQWIKTNRRAISDRKANASHCAPLSPNVSRATSNSAIPGSGCIS